MSFQRLSDLLSVILIVAAAMTLLHCSCGSDTADTRQTAISTQPGSATRPGSTTQPAAKWRPPTPRAANERVEERNRMVETQIARPLDWRTPVHDQRVLEAMRAVPRHVFVPRVRRGLAYADGALPIGHNQTISQPYIVALMTELLQLTPETKVLEIGTGSGYQAAVLAHLTPHVYSIELLEPLAERARRTLREQGYDKVHCRCGDGYLGWPEAAPFDVIILTCAIAEVPGPLWEQLKPGGRIVMPMGAPYGVQRLVVHTKTPDGKRRTQTVTEVQFVPLVRDKGGE